MNAESVAPPLLNRTEVVRQTPPSVFRCAALITATKIALKVVGFDRTLRWIRHRVTAIPATTACPVEHVRCVEHSLAMAAAFYPGRAKCLEQSLALYYLMRKDGVAVRYRQGVMAHPFEAHAWVEYRNEVVNDVVEHTRDFVPLPDLLP